MIGSQLSASKTQVRMGYMNSWQSNVLSFSDTKRQSSAFKTEFELFNTWVLGWV